MGAKKPPKDVDNRPIGGLFSFLPFVKDPFGKAKFVFYLKPCAIV